MTRTILDILDSSPVLYALRLCTLTTAPLAEKILKLLRLKPGDGENGLL